MKIPGDPRHCKPGRKPPCHCRARSKGWRGGKAAQGRWASQETCRHNTEKTPRAKGVSVPADTPYPEKQKFNMPEVRGKLWGMFLILCIPHIFAANIAGTVLDSETGMPIADVRVEIDSRYSYTGPDGGFYFDNIRPGDYEIATNHIAYNPIDTKIEVIDGANPSLVFRLKPRVFASKQITIESAASPNIVIIEDDEAAREIESYIKELPGIDIIEGDGRSEISFRGSRPRDVLVVVDGIPLPRDETGATDISTIDAGEIRSVVLVTEGIPARYSTQAPAGVVFLETVKERNFTVRVEAGTASWDEYTSCAGIGLPLPAGIHSEFSVDYNSAVNDFEYIYADTSAIRENNYSENLKLRLNLHTSAPNADVRLRLSYYDSRDAMPGDLDHPTPEANRDSDGLRATFNSRYSLPLDITVLADAGYANSKTNYFSPRPYVYVSVDSDHLIDQIDIGLLAEKRFSVVNPEIGFSFSAESYELINNLNSDLNIDRVTRTRFAGWLETPVEYEFSDLLRLDVKPALKWDVLDSLSPERRLCFEGGASFFKWGANIGFSAGYAEAFLLPTFTDLYWLRDAYAEGNPDLAPEESYKRHVRVFCGYEWRFWGISASMDFFSRTVDSVIVWKRGFDGLYRPMNFAKEETDGREDIIELQIGDFLEFSWINTLLTPIHRSPDRVLDSLWLPFRPGYYQKLTLRLENSGFAAQLDGRMVGKRYLLEANTKWADPYEVWDLTVKYTHHLGNWTVSAMLYFENILDENYEILEGYPMPGRSFGAGLKMNYK